MRIINQTETELHVISSKKAHLKTIERFAGPEWECGPGINDCYSSVLYPRNFVHKLYRKEG